MKSGCISQSEDKDVPYNILKNAIDALLEAHRVKSDMPTTDAEAMQILEQSTEDYQNTFCREALKKHTYDWTSIKGYVNDILHNLDWKAKAVTKNMEKTAASNPKLLEIVQFSSNVVEDVFVHKVLCHIRAKIEGLSVYTDYQTSVQSPLNWTDAFVAPGTYIPSFGGHRRPFNQAGKRYDFFVLHSEADNDWVVCCLLQQLEYGQYGFKGCVRERDFEEGKTILENIKDKLNESNKILVVITRKTPESFLQELDKHHILQSLDPFRDQNDQLVEVLSAKCAVDEDRKITSSSILELGIPRVPIYEAVTQLGSAESTLEYGFPESDVLRLYERHVVCFDVQKRLAKWVAYKLTKDDIEGPGNRDDCRFQQDEKLPDEFQPTTSTFKDKFTRGHMVPAADSKSSQSAMRDTFKFTNIYPEYKNNKMWTAVEVYIREKVLEKFPQVWIYIIPAFKANDSDIVAFKTVGETGVAVPSHMFKFVIAVSESGDGTLVTGAFRVRNAQDYGCTELKKGDSAFANVFENEVISNIGTIATDTGIRFGEMLKTKGHVYNEDLLKNCSFITADEFKGYEEKGIKDKIARKQKDKEQKSAK